MTSFKFIARKERLLPGIDGALKRRPYTRSSQRSGAARIDCGAGSMAG
jgi:hypothetical protein